MSVPSERKKRIVSGRIAELRRELGFTQEKFAEEIGVATNTISRIEQKTMSLSSDVALRIADMFGVSLDWLFYRSEIKTNLQHEENFKKALGCIGTSIKGKRTLKLDKKKMDA